jgi:hypothetical protein
MCPICMAEVALLIATAASTGGATALALMSRRTKSTAKRFVPTADATTGGRDDDDFSR